MNNYLTTSKIHEGSSRISIAEEDKEVILRLMGFHKRTGLVSVKCVSLQSDPNSVTTSLT